LLIKMLLEKELGEIGKVYVSRGAINEEEHRMYVKMVDVFVVTMLMTYDEEAILKSLEPLQLFSEHTKYLIVPLNT
jgi:hypothetical protein